METKTRIIIVSAVIVVAILVAVVIFWPKAVISSPKMDAFAQCIASKGAKFYGAFWCPHCQAQKELFGSSVKYLPYVECSTPDTNGQLQVCIDQKIAAYPTWKFSDGTTKEGEMTLRELADKTGCALP